ncbi:MAG: M4 family metallopeptidase [Bacteroidetes bacterium]|nr:M4 family metallopeptidase [Bacteroidota bacterium]
MIRSIRQFIIAAAGICVLLPLQAQQRQTSSSGTVLRSDKNGIANFVKFDGSQKPLVSQLPELFRKTFSMTDKDTFEALKVETDALGMTHHSFQQLHQGIPVFGAIVKVHCQGENVVSISGCFAAEAKSGKTVLSSEDALTTAIHKTGAQKLIWEMPGQEQFYQRIYGRADASWRPKGELWYVKTGSDQASKYRLAWKLDIYAVEPLFRADIYVDAETGEILFRNERLHTADANGIGHSRYSGIQPIVTDSVDPTTFRLRESGRALGVETFNMNNGTDYNMATDFVDSNNVWDVFAQAFDNSAIDAHWGAEMTYDYFMQFHGRDSYDDAASKLISFVHFDNSYSNAFWNGTFMTYGDGGGNNNPFQGLDVCGHEFAHGVTQFTAGLVYQYESGALNESFSDIFGNTIEFWARPTNASWRIGDDIGAFRSMANPSQYMNPDTYLGSFWATGGWDNGGVHTNSGVQNFWYYLLSEGGSGTNDNGDNYSVAGIGIDSAAAIAYRNLSVYLSPNDGYADARFYSIQSAIDLFGECSPAMISTMNAWHAVGVGSAYTGTLVADFYTQDSNLCEVSAPVRFTNQSTSALSYLWNFGDGSTSTLENPTHTYTFVGDYDVTLIAFGCNGSKDTLVYPNRIHIDLNQPCNVNMPVGSDSLLLTACEGNLFDSGGSDDYLNNSNGVVRIQPGGLNQVQLTFSVFNFAAGDRVTIYDGPSVNSPVIGIYAGTTLPPVITSSNGALTLRESTNGANVREGFLASWNCLSVGTDEMQESACQVYPNPTHGNLEIRWVRGAAEESEWIVFDGLGRSLRKEMSRHNGVWQASLDLSTLSAGVYSLQLRSGNAQIVKRIVVQ